MLHESRVRGGLSQLFHHNGGRVGATVIDDKNLELREPTRKRRLGFTHGLCDHCRLVVGRDDQT